MKSGYRKTHSTKIGFLIGAGLGFFIGLTVGANLFFISGSSLIFASGVLTVFTIIIVAGGGFMGLLFDVDAHERNGNKLTEAQPAAVIQQRTTLQPATRHLL